MNINKLLFSVSISMIFLFSSCEKDNNGVVDQALMPPFLVSLTSSNSTLNLDTTTSDAVTRLPNNMFKISGSVVANVTDPNGWQDIRQVSYRIYQPSSSNYITSGSLNRLDSAYSAN